MKVTRIIEVVAEDCCVCAVTFGMPDDLMERRKQDGKGGRHIEHGIAIAYVDNWPWAGAGQNESVFRLILIGPRENIFHCHPATEVYPDWGSFLDAETTRQEQP